MISNRSLKKRNSSSNMALLQVTLGWSEAALAAGSRDIGLSQAAAGVFSRGGVELLEVRALMLSLIPVNVPVYVNLDLSVLCFFYKIWRRGGETGLASILFCLPVQVPVLEI
jgi:hypothetical protein